MKKRPICLFFATVGLMAVTLVGVAPAETGFWERAANSLAVQPAVTSPSSILSNSDMSAGLKEALRIGAENVVGKLGKKNGFALDKIARIPLPPTLQKVDKALSAMGMGWMMDDLENRLNTAAEAATPKAKKLFVGAIQKMTITDAKAILDGPNDAATRYLQKTMRPELVKEMQPLIKASLADAGAIKSYDAIMGQYEQMPFVSSVKENLNTYVVDKAISGIFYYVAQEEMAIRKYPVKRTTELLKKTFTPILNR